MLEETCVEGEALGAESHLMEPLAELGLTVIEAPSSPNVEAIANKVEQEVLAEMKPAKAPKGQHIFNADKIQPEAIRWKSLVAQGRLEEADKLMEEIIPQCKNLFSRFAQYEKFDTNVELNSLINEAMLRVPHWIHYWKPDTSPLFTYISVCSKRLFGGMAKKESDYRGRYFASGDNLEKFCGSEDHEVEKHDAAKELKDRLSDITSRWRCKQSNDAIRMYIDVLVSGDKINKKALQRAASYAYGISPQLAKFYYTWTLVAMRDIMYDKLRIKYTDQDLFRLSHSYTFLPDILTVITWQQMIKIMGLFGGQRIKIPTLDSITSTKKEVELYRELDKVQTPEEFGKIAKKHGFTDKSAQKVYDKMTNVLNQAHDSEHSLYDVEEGDEE